MRRIGIAFPWLIRIAFWVIVWGITAAPCPSRTFTYTTGNIINPSENTTNENNLYNYLCTGVDTLAGSSVSTTALQDAAVTAAKLGTGAVTTTIILDATITASDLATDSVEAAEIATDAVGAPEIVAGAVGTSEIATDGVGADEIVVDSVGNSEIAANAVDGTNIALGADAQGDVMYYNGTDWVRLAPGTDGQFLETNGAAANPTWSTVAPIYQYITGTWSITASTAVTNVLSAVAGRRWFLMNLSINVTNAVDSSNEPLAIILTLDNGTNVTIEGLDIIEGVVDRWHYIDLLHHHIADTGTSDTAPIHGWETDATAFWTDLDGRYITNVAVQHGGVGTGTTAGTIHGMFLEF